MDRRTFFTLVSGGALLATSRLFAEHHVLSADPLLSVFDLSSSPDRYTDIEDFYIRNHHATPPDTGKNLLRIEGEVDEPKEMTIESLANLPRREIGAVLECAGNTVGTTGLVSNGLWRGWPLGDVLSLARPKRSGTHVHLVGRDGYVRSVPVERIHSDGLLVTHLNSLPLRRHHGAPWRALLVGWYGMDSVKWLERITVSTSDLPVTGNEYTESTLDPSGQVSRQPLPRVQVKSVIVSPTSGAVLRRGKTEVRAFAWSGEGKISKLEASADGGRTWHTAELQRSTPHEWALGRITLELNQSGAVELVCRATDERGFSQPIEQDRRRLDGYANNWCHRVRCVVV